MLIKYLFKYVSKGSDRCRIVVQKENDDEIKAYLNYHFICPYEAVWRPFQFPIHSRNPPVEHLQVHLPSEHNIVYSGNESLLNKQWSTRTKGFSLGRLTYVHPTPGELYFLRLLLSHVKGVLSFDDLRKVSGVLYPTFKLACKSLGLLGDDKE
uniref:Uncharacterized protein n=1 Tax=Salix viminalis TaxID=40686 RepID=A0A6N2L014_SALVM